MSLKKRVQKLEEHLRSASPVIRGCVFEIVGKDDAGELVILGSIKWMAGQAPGEYQAQEDKPITLSSG